MRQLLSLVTCYLSLAALCAAQVTIPWTDVDKTGSSLADLTTRSAGDLNSGTLDNARLDADLTSWAAITRAAGFDTFVATPSGANLASLLTTALPASKGGTGLTALSANIVTLLGAADYAAMRTQLTLVPGTDVQAYDADLLSIAGNTTGGFLTRTAANTYTPRSLAGTSGEIDVANADGVAGAPTISLPSTITQATTFSDTTASTSTSTGALVVGTNVGLSGNAGGPSYFGGGINVTGILRADGNYHGIGVEPFYSVAVSLGGSAGSAFGSTNGVHVRSALNAGANGDVMYGMNVDTPLAKGAFTGLTYIALRLSNPGSVTGTGTIDTSWGLKIDSMTRGTTNYAIQTGTGLVAFGDTTASTSTSTGSATFGGGIGVAGRTSTATLNVGGTNGTTADLIASATATLDFASIAAGATAELTITVTGAATGDSVHPGPPAALEAGLTATSYVSAANTVTIRLHNTTGGAIDPASATWRATVTSF